MITQKNLLNKTAVSQIKILLQKAASERNVIYIHGPVGSGKTTAIQVLCKSYDVLKIDPDSIRKAETSQVLLKDIINSCGIMSWAEILSKGQKKSKKKIVVIDGIDLCEKTIKPFLEAIPEQVIRELQIILISPDPPLRFISSLSFVTTVQFIHPTKEELIDLTKLRNPKLSNEQIEEMIQKSEFDVRQLLTFIDNRLPSNDSKIKDYDLEEKTLGIMEPNRPLDKAFLLAGSEPTVLTWSIFNNYLSQNDLQSKLEKMSVADSVEESQTGSDLQQATDKTCLKNFEKIIDSISMSDTFGEQSWESSDVVSILGCVIPSFYSTGIEPSMYSNIGPSSVCTLKSREEIIITNWLKEPKGEEKFADYLIDKRLHQDKEDKIDFSVPCRLPTASVKVPKGMKIKLTKVQKSKISKALYSKIKVSNIPNSSQKKCSNSKTKKEEVEVNLQWFKF
jgi:dephospho-CoA kinase